MTTTDTRDAEVAARKARALAIACPFCAATAGQMCRSRARGREKDWPHSRRIEVATPVDERYRPTRVKALCCVCGNLRTVTSDYHRHNDLNYAGGEQGKREGWRSTQTLKCQECAQCTRHAILARADSSWRDSDERYQRYALGGEWEGQYPPDRDRIRAEYQQQFPRNPKLHHKFWTTDAEKALAEGNPLIPALCGTPVETPAADRDNGPDITEPQAPMDFTDTEYEDPESGLWWIDMDCVDCLRVCNAEIARSQRRRLEHLLMTLSVHPEKIADHRVADVLEYLERISGEG